MSTLATSTQHCSGGRNGAIKPENETKDIWTEKEEIKLDLFADYVILNLENPK